MNKEIKRRQSKHLATHIQMFEGLSSEKRQAELSEANDDNKFPGFSVQYREFSNG